MEEEEHTDSKMQLAMLSKKLQNIKKHLNEDNTDNINQIISSDSPETCWSYLLNLEKKGNPHTDSNFLTRLIDYYTRVFSNFTLAKHSQNESYARILVRFAQLKAIQDPDEARDHFTVARSNSNAFSFVHIAHANFEFSQGNAKKSTSILQRAFEVNAKPTGLLEMALQNLKVGKTPLLSTDDKENLMVPVTSNSQESRKSSMEFHKVTPSSDGSGELQLGSVFPRVDQNSVSQEDPVAIWRSGPQRRRICNMPGRVPVLPFSIPEAEGREENGGQRKRSDPSCPSSNMTRQISGSREHTVVPFSSSKKASGDGDSYSLLNLKPSVISPEPHPWEDSEATESTTVFLHRPDRKVSTRTDVCTENLNQIISSNSPESCWTYLRNLEKKGNPHTDSNLLTKLINYYCRVFSSFPLGKYSQNESYARMLVRFAELKAIQDDDEAQDNFTIARSNCKSFAFVHIAHAQFKLSQGNAKKSAAILQRAFELNAKPTWLLEMALKNLKAGKNPLLSTDNKENLMGEPISHTSVTGQSETMERLENQSKLPANLGPYKPVCNPPSDWKIPARIGRYISPEDKKFPTSQVPTPQAAEHVPAPSILPPARGNPPLTCETPNQKPLNANSFVTPVVKRNPPVMASVPAPHCFGASQQPCTPQNQVCPPQQTPQGSVSALSNDSITIKGRQFFILKMIGQGGSSKVYQVLDHRRQLFAVKYVNLEEADSQTVEGYKNEIEHLNHLQQYSDQIIKLHDYEITNRYIYMLMECGNLDLNTWLRKRKSVNPLERKFYWKNMLEAVQTIHKHGIIHSDLKPANFILVNGSLKLIDFGISNRIQPDVTSIVKDSQVGTLNYMSPEAIKDPSSKAGKPSSKISAKGDVWSLGCILYCMTYGKTPFQKITNQFTKMHAIIDPSHEIEFPDIAEKDLLDVLQKCLLRNPKQRISISELLAHPYLQLQPQSVPEPAHHSNNDLKRILSELAALQSPNSIVRAASNLAKMCDSGKRLDVSECVRSAET